MTFPKITEDRKTGRVVVGTDTLGRPIRRIVRFDWIMAQVEEQGDCLVFTGLTNAKGYGRFTAKKGEKSLTHQAVYEHFHGPIPDGQLVRHSCDNPPCVRIGHLSLGTAADNSADAVSRNRTARTIGEKSGKAKLTASQVQTMRQLAAGGATLTGLGLRFGVDPAHVSRIVNGHRWPEERAS